MFISCFIQQLTKDDFIENNNNLNFNVSLKLDSQFSFSNEINFYKDLLMGQNNNNNNNKNNNYEKDFDEFKNEIRDIIYKNNQDIRCFYQTKHQFLPVHNP